MFGWLKRERAATPPKIDWVEYRGYQIAATPEKDGAQYRVAGIIKRPGEDEQLHNFKRADLIPSEDEAREFTLMKARLMIDQMGERLFE